MSDIQGSRPRRRVTTADIARASGFSRATVSYVLNDAPGKGISEQTKKHVLRVASELGHIPNGAARSLRLGRSQIVLALIRHYAIGHVADRLIDSLDRALTERGLVLVVHRYEENALSIPELWGMISPDLIVSMGGLQPPDLPQNSPVRLVPIHGVFPHGRAAEMQIEYLHSRGHRNIGYATLQDDPRVELIAAERHAGVSAAQERLGLPPLVTQSFAVGDVDAADEAISTWLSGAEPVTAVATHNDELALMLISALRHRGLEPGRDLAVIGIDNIPLARVEVTTVEIDIERYASAIVARTIAALDDDATPPQQSGTEGFLHLVVRSSA